MGRDKARIPVPAPTASDPELAGPDPERAAAPPGPLAAGAAEVPLAERTAVLLRAVAGPVVEVGPGRSSLPAVSEEPPGAGPLAAVAAGASALAAAGWRGPVLVVATDLPLLDLGLLRWLAAHPDSRSVVPLAAGRVQPLCARYSAVDLDTAARLVGSGRRAMGDLLAAIDANRAPEEEWVPRAVHPAVLADADTPEDLERLLTGRRPERPEAR